MFARMYPFWSFVISVAITQLLKPFFNMHNKKINFRLVLASGGFPSSHTAGVAALTYAVGKIEHFDSTIFALSLAFAIIVSYDAANVRYYAGKNIKLTKQLVSDLRNENIIPTDESIYCENLKDVLGHKWSEVLVGGLLGVVISELLYLLK